MGGFRIATVRGIPIRIHWTFLVIIPILAYAFGRAFLQTAVAAGIPPWALSPVTPWLWGLGLGLSLFASVLLHELAHSFYALRRGAHVKDIVLLLIGGVSRIEELPEVPRYEAMMAFVGPLTSLVLGGIFFGVEALLSRGGGFGVRFFFFYLASINVLLGIFNLLPAFPMDGGRILRALLCGRMGKVRATKVASWFGKGFAVLFGLWGLFSLDLILLLVAFFIYLGAEAEARMTIETAAVEGLTVKDLMSPHLRSVSGRSNAEEVAERMAREHREGFAVTSDGKVVGVVTLEAIRKVPARVRAATRIAELAQRMPVLAPTDEARKAIRLMMEANLPQVAVVEDGRLVGTLSREDIAQALERRASSGQTNRPRPVKRRSTMTRYVLPELPYEPGALAPYVSDEALALHRKVHRHHVEQANEAISELIAARHAKDFTALASLERSLAFHVSGHVLHSLFWRNLSPEGGGAPRGVLGAAIERDFGGFDAFRMQLTHAALSLEGPGWAALVWDPLTRRLGTTQIHGHASQITQGEIPLLVMDVWEHAYWSQYPADRDRWLDSLWNLWSWDDVARRWMRAQQVDLELGEVAMGAPASSEFEAPSLH